MRQRYAVMKYYDPRIKIWEDFDIPALPLLEMKLIKAIILKNYPDIKLAIIFVSKMYFNQSVTLNSKTEEK